MSGYLIKDTTREEREQIVAESLGNIEATCDGYMRQGTLFRTKTTSPRPVQRCAGFFLTRKNQSDMILISK